MKLFLTVGTNPLPVWVAGHNLLRYYSEKALQITNLYFVVSSQTEKSARIIFKKLKEEFPSHPALQHERFIKTGSAGNPKVIVEEVSKYLTPEDQCHLHYTGATKALAVHTWEALTTIITDQANRTASYLDPRGGNMGPFIIDNSGLTIIPDCRNGISLTIKQLLELHSYELQGDPVDPPSKWPSQLFELLCNCDHWKSYERYYGQWCAMRDAIRENRKETPIGKYPAPDIAGWPEFSILFNSWLAGQGMFSTFDDHGDFVKNPKDKVKNIDKIVDELFGKFLEYALFATCNEVLQVIAVENPNRNNYAVANSIRPQRIRGPKSTVDNSILPQCTPASKNFELDVVVLLGYQLVLFSCTTDPSQKEIKLKGMEAIHRAKQIGGDEARTVVLCGSGEDVANAVKEELFRDYGHDCDEGLIEMWGYNEWPDLHNKLKDYFTNTLRW